MEAKMKHNRFKDAPWFPHDKDVHVLVGGAGGIGSWTTLLLSRAGFVPMVYDFDTLEEHNMGGQLYSNRAIGMPKVTALHAVVAQFADEDIPVFNEKIDFDTPTHIFAVSAFDNMEARKVMFNKWKNTYCVGGDTHDDRAIFIDGRLEAEQMWIYCVTNDLQRIVEYEEKHLFHDSEIAEVPCTMKQTSHAAAMIASHITAFFTNHITNLFDGDNVRAVPFFWNYFIPMDLLEIDNNI